LDAELDAVAEEVSKLTASAVEAAAADLDLGGPIRLEPSKYPLSKDEIAAAAMYFAKPSLKPVEALFSKYKEDAASLTYLQNGMRARVRESKSEVLGSAILPVAVAAFEQYIASLFRSGLMKFPYALGELPPAHYELVSKYDSADLKKYLIDRRVRDVLREAPTDWERKIEKWTKIKVGDLGIGWDHILEAIQRRHALVHNGGVIDEEYLQKVPAWARENKRIGQSLACSVGYTLEALRKIRVFALIFGLKWARHFGKSDALAVYPDLVMAVYALEKDGDWSTALRLSNAAMELQDANDESFQLLRVNWWLCRKKLMKSDAEMELDIRAWEPENDRLWMARAALLENDADLAERIQLAGASGPGGRVSRRQLAEMPIFHDSIQRSDTVRRLLKGGGYNPKLHSTAARPPQTRRGRSRRSR